MREGVKTRLLLGTLGLGLILAGPALAQPAMRLGAPAPAPAGYLRFCAANPSECSAQSPALVRTIAKLALSATGIASPATATVSGTQASAAIPLDWEAVTKAPAPVMDAPLVLTPETRALLSRVNSAVNRGIARRDDEIGDAWSLPLRDGAKVGDCEDYVLEKRRALIQAGVPAEALSIAVAKTQHGQNHALLLVATDRGELALDNLSPWISRWDQTPYRWVQRQAPGKPLQWVAID